MIFKWHQNPDQAVAKKCRILEEIRKESGSSAYWAACRQELKRDPWFLMRVALEWAWLDEDLVGHSFIKHLSDNWGEDIAILFPRGHGKTLPMAAIIIGQILNDPNTAILNITRTDDNADRFGQMVGQHLMENDYLQRCFGSKYNSDGILPSSTAECGAWGKDGYSLPKRKPRLDPTLYCISLNGAKAGKHPDWIYLDDLTERENNNPKGWAEVIDVVNGCKMLLPSDGHFVWTGTRWHDGDPMGAVKAGKLKGQQGDFNTIQFSCYVDDNPTKQPTYPRKKRWNMVKETGFTHEQLEAKRAPLEVGGLGEFFDAQMRNDPAPAERADIKVKDIYIYKPEELPKIGHVRSVGIETTGGGLVLYNGLVEKCDQLKLSLPLTQITNPRKIGITKRDRIVAALQPIVNRGGLKCQDWMIGDSDALDNLGYELRRLGKAAHDDIADALHNVPVHLSANMVPSKPEEPAHLYISVDLAYSEEKRSDFSVVMAVAIDHRGDYWVLDYDRFQISSPTGIYDRLLAFYQKYEESTERKRMSLKKYPGAWR